MSREGCCLPVCPGLSMSTAIFMDGLVVASGIAISDLVHRHVDPDNSAVGIAFAAHIFAAFAIIVALRIFLYQAFWYGRGSLADRSMIHPPGCRDFFDCPGEASINNCYAPWWSTLERGTYEKTVAEGSY